MSKKINIKDLHQDDKNFNRHTESGMDLLEKSVGKVGVIESITVSGDDKIISGNARQKVMSEKFSEVEPIVIETDGTRPVILKRTDIQSNTREFHEAALLANTVAKKNINLDYDAIEEVAIQEFGIDVEELGVDVFVSPYASDDQEDEEEIDLSKFTHSANSYLNNTIRQIVLIYEQELHGQILSRLSDIGRIFNITDDNSSVVLKLIEFYESQKG